MEVDKKTLLALVEAAIAADYTGVRRAGNEIAKSFLDAKDVEGAKALQSLLRRKGVPLQASGYAEALPRDAGSRLPLVEEGSWPSIPLMLNDDTAHVVAQFVEDAKHIELLTSRGVSTRLGLLLYGKPGTGKSLLAAHIAAMLKRPFYVARLDSLISSRLGETAKNIRGIFEFAPARNAVLFLDEMDAVAKLRDDRNELGELKRVVNTVLQGLDSLPNDVVVIGATNHPHLLDPAIWRRFPYKTELALPDAGVRRLMWLHFLFEEKDSPLASTLAAVSDGLSGADIENIALAARRRAILRDQAPELTDLVLAISSFKKGAHRLFSDRELTTEDRIDVARTLHLVAAMPVAEIAKVIRVSRQMVYRYIEEQPNE